MSHARKPMSPKEFLAWEACQEMKWEFDGVQPVAMVGETRAHSVIQRNLLTALTNRLRVSPCQPYGNELKVQIGLRYHYPDALVSRTPFANTETIAAEPVVIFEVLSPSTAAIDRTTKLAEYQALASVRRIVLIEQDSAYATSITRAGQGWDLALTGPGGVLAMPEIGVEMPLAELYDGLTFATGAVHSAEG